MRCFLSINPHQNFLFCEYPVTILSISIWVGNKLGLAHLAGTRRVNKFLLAKQCQSQSILRKQIMNAMEQLFEENFIKEAITEFIRKIYLLLENPIYFECVCWEADERTVVIKDTRKLVAEVLPIVFKQRTLKSFIRQLNMYNFRKAKDGQNPKYLYFRNSHFMRGNIQELIFIKRKQRGYVEKCKLQNLKSKSLLEKYTTFTNGVMNKLRGQLSPLAESHPKLCSDVFGLMRAFTANPLHLHQTEAEIPLKPINDELLNRCQRGGYGGYNGNPLFESVYDLYPQFPPDLPDFGSELSIPEDPEDDASMGNFSD